MTLPLNLYTADQLRELDRIAIEEFKIPGLTLMQRAGQATFDHILDRYPRTQSISVICGTGNNGGDGYVIATLASKMNLKVTLIQLGDDNTVSGDALLAREAYLEAGGKTSAFSIALLQSEIIVDAIFGTGLTREVSDDWAKVVNLINEAPAKKIAVDIPSGLCADTGRILGTCVKADMTVTYIGLKCGLFTGQARDVVGEIKFNDLEVPYAVYQKLTSAPSKELIPDTIISKNLKPRSRCSHKGHFGHVLLIGGANGMPGAIHLAAEASLRCGAGLVSVATHPSHADYLNMTRPEMMVHAVHQISALEPLLEKATAIVIGPGLGTSVWARELLSATLLTNKPIVVDADALNLLSESQQSTLMKQHDNWILTPHPKEASRLLGLTTQAVEADRYQSVEKTAQKWGGVCVLKGAGSLICDGNKTAVCNAGNPGMASGGMGDVLSGIIVALLAQDLTLFDAAATGTYLHAKAADFAAKNGERGMLASDLFPYLRMLINNKTELLKD